MGFRKALVVTRYAEGTVTDGVYTEGTTETINITGSLQPLKPEDVQQFAFGRRNSKYMYVITSTRLFPVRPAVGNTAAKNPDQVSIAGELYTVDREEIWQNSVIPHYKYLVVKEIEE